MSRKNKHINKYLHDDLPEPEVRADEAWAQMNDMLVAASAGGALSVMGKVTSLISKFKLPLLILGGGVPAMVVATFLILKSAPEVTQQKTKSGKETILKEQELPVNQMVAITEPAEGNIASTEQNNTPALEENERTIRKENNINALKENETAPAKENSIASSPNIIVEPNKASVTRRNPGTYSKTELASSKTTDDNKRGFASASHEKLSLPQHKKTSPIDPKSKNRLVENTNRYGSPYSGPRPMSRTGNAANQQNENLSEYEVSNNQKSPTKTLEASDAAPAQKLVISLLPRPAQIPTFNPNLEKRIKNHRSPKTATTVAEHKEQIENTLHFGLEWSMNTSFQQTSYLFTGADSISRPTRLLIPGIFVAKNWREHGITFSFAPYQSYFGNNKRIRHRPDSVYVGDSAQFFYNTNFIKAVGMNFTVQYQYRVTGFLSFSAGASYSPFSKALLRKENENWEGKILPGPLETVKKTGDLNSFLNPRLFALKAGLLFHPGRIQAGFNVIVPLSNVSNTSEYPVKALNGQIFLRFLVR